RPLMEYIIFFKNNLEELVLLARAGVIQNPEAFIRTLVQDPKLMQEKPNLPANLQKTLRPLVKYSIKKEIPSKKIDNAVPEPVQDWQTLTTQIVSTGGSQPAPSDYVASLSEKEILAGIKAEDPQFLEDNGGLVHSLIGVGFFKAALELLRIKKNDPRFFYLKCHTLLELGKYHELIDYIEFIFSFKLGEEEEVPFYYIMALAYLALKRKESARACFKRVVKIDPNFRNAKELLLSAKAE
ncbi:MAG: tetratricopeptide repeat protein, partial [Bacteriovoracaceae bacterium]